jgi:uncharacterized protein (TIGR01777 family)
MARDGIRTIAVTGASGLIGRALVRSLAAREYRVISLVRRPPRTPDEVAWDPAAARLDPAELRGIDGLVHLAGENLAGGLWTAARRRRILESRQTGTSLLASAVAALAEPPRVMISMSAVGYYGHQGDRPLTETAPNGDGFLAEVCRVWEASAEPARAAGIRVVHPRTGVVLHPEGGMLNRLLLPFRLGLGARLGNGRQFVSWITRDDAVAVIRFLLERADVAGAVNVTSPEPVTNREFTETLARVLHRPAGLAIPAPVLTLLLGDLAREALLSSTRALPARLEDLGFRFSHPALEPALRQVLGH